MIGKVATLLKGVIFKKVLRPTAGHMCPAVFHLLEELR